MNYIKEFSYTCLRNIVIFIIPSILDKSNFSNGLQYITQFLQYS
jgi:hypothetical protein